MRNLTNYLNDHLAGSVGALELLDHLIEKCEDPSLTTALKALRREIDQDQSVLQEIIRQLGGKQSVIRKAGAWAVEKMSRAKLETEDERLGLLQSLEGLCLGVLGKRALWRTLARAAGSIMELRAWDYADLEKRAAEQFERIEAMCLHLGSSVLGEP